VFSGKPLAQAEDAFTEIGQRVADSGLVVDVGVNCRFRWQLARVHDIAEQGTMSSLRFIRGTYVINAVETVRERQKPWALNFPGRSSSGFDGTTTPAVR
jgi:predicted dehydrogenase